MKGRLRVLAVIGLVAVTALTVAATAGAKRGAQAKHPGLQNTAYFIEWGIYGRNYLVKNVETSGQAAKLTAVNYAFSNAIPDGDHVACKLADEWADYQKPWAPADSVSGNEVTWPNPVLGNFEQLKELKALHPDLKVLISIGGWTFSKYFSDAALTPASRQAFVQSCVDLFIKGNLPDPGWGGMGGPGSAAGIFDGIDIDWEWPGSAGNDGNIIRAADKANFVSLLQEFRSQLDAYGATQGGKHYLLTSFLPANPSAIAAGVDPAIFGPLDFGNLQGYDLHGSWDSSTNFQSNLRVPLSAPAPRFSVSDVVQSYQRLGVPNGKLVVGVPFYSYGWTGVPTTNNGLYQPSTGPAPGVWAPGTNDYKAVAPLLGSGYTRYYDPSTAAAWLFNGSTFWTFDDPSILQAKADFVASRKLGGIMAWELSGDTTDGSLETGIATGLWGAP